MGKIVMTGDMVWNFPYFKPDGESPSPYLCQVELDHEIPPGMLFHDCLVAIANGHKAHTQGTTYSCYGSWIGNGLVWLLYPLESLDEDTKRISDETALCDTQGVDAGRKVYADFKGTLISDKKKLLEYVEAYSHPKAKNEDGSTPMEYLFYSTIQLSPHCEEVEFGIAYKKIIEAHRQHPQGIHWLTYKEVGGSALHTFAPMRRFGEMDTWPSLVEVLSVYDPVESAWIRDIYYQNIQSQKVQIMTYVPSCDNSGAEFVE
jgi:hypothetical protein